MKAYGLGTLYRRAQVWWIQYSARGKLHRESSHSRVRADAARLLRKRVAEMGHGGKVGRDAEKVSFDDLVALIQADCRRPPIPAHF